MAAVRSWLVPNPFYVTYPAAVLAAGRRTLLCAGPRRRDRPFPSPISMLCPKPILERTGGPPFFCSPSNPEGRVRQRRRIGDACSSLQTATIFNRCWADECYCENLRCRAAARRPFPSVTR